MEAVGCVPSCRFGTITDTGTVVHVLFFRFRLVFRVFRVLFHVPVACVGEVMVRTYVHWRCGCVHRILCCQQLPDAAGAVNINKILVGFGSRVSHSNVRRRCGR